MYRIMSMNPPAASDGHVDLSFRETDSWFPYAGGHGLVVLLGDEDCGPFAFFSSMPPMEEMMPVGFAHGHDSDNWRISVQGTTNMGRDAYTDGQFRFQDGGVPYAADNVTWGPDGGFGMVMFADRRGFAIRPVKAEIAERVIPQQEAQGKQLGIDVQHPCPGAPAIATTFGATDRGQLVEGFDSADSWDEVRPGRRCAVGVLGEPDAGPVLVLTRAAAGAVGVPASVVDTESLTLIIRGTATAGDSTLGVGDVRLQEAGAASAELVAGPDGLDVVTIIADRRAVDAGADSDEWLADIRSVADSLRKELATA